jgi:hypothetical protein
MAVLVACCACSPSSNPETVRSNSLTTNTDSQSLPDRDQRLAFLARYLRAKSSIVDAEFIIRYRDNSKGAIPGPSDWDIRAVLQVESQPSAWHEGWVPCTTEGATGESPPKVDAAWAEPLLGRRTQWQALRSPPRCYRNPRAAASVVFVYEEENVVLYRNTTEPAAQ